MAPRTSTARWSCAAGGEPTPRATPTASAWASRALPCLTSRTPAASYSGAIARALARLDHATATVAALSWCSPHRGRSASRRARQQGRPLAPGAARHRRRTGTRDRQCHDRRGWYDLAFVRDWTNGPLLVRADNGRLLSERDLSPAGSATNGRGLGREAQRPLVYDPALRRYEPDGAEPGALRRVQDRTRRRGRVPARLRSRRRVCRRYAPDVAEPVCGIGRDQIENGRATAVGIAAGRLLCLERGRAAEQRHPDLPGDLGALRPYRQLRRPGGNVLFPSVPAANVAGDDLMSAEQLSRALGLPERPLGPSRWGWVTTDEVYRAVLEQRPYPGAGPGRVRSEPAPCPRRRRTGTRGARCARLLRACRPVHDPHGRDGRSGAAGRDAVRAGGSQDRLRGEPGCAVAGATAASCRRAMRRVPLGHRHRVRTRLPSRPRRPLLERRHRGGLPPAARAVRRHARSAARAPRRGAGAARRPATASTPSRRMASRTDSPRRRERSSCTPRRSSTMGIGRCRSTRNRSSDRSRGLTWPCASR